mgnify:CR=1 FL=1
MKYDAERAFDAIIDALPEEVELGELASLFVCVAGFYGIEGKRAEEFFSTIAAKSQESLAAARAAYAIEQAKKNARR